MTGTQQWWQTGIIYQVYPRSFQDSNGDGIGDLQGIRQRLDYLAWLGIDSVWISPIFPSPMADFGYDVSDYTAIHPIFGTMDDLDALTVDLHQRGMKIILDWVPNHTSDQHPWFLESRSSRGNPKRDWYIWADPAPDGGPPTNWLAVFGGDAWEWDELTGQYYYHAFAKEQPDLNWRNPAVQEAMHDTIRFWLDRGVDGIRVDAYWFLFEDPELRDEPPDPDGDPGYPFSTLDHIHTQDLPEMLVATTALRKVFDEYDDRVSIGELYLPFDRLIPYYGTPDELRFHLPFNFRLITGPWNAREICADVATYEQSLTDFGWPNWVIGNHDRDRIATRVGAGQARVAAMLLLTLRGTPTIYQGEELGMENVPIPLELIQDPQGKSTPEIGRDPARTPMQWDASSGAGFTTGTPWLPFEASCAARNVAVERDDPGSMLSLYHDLIALRRKEDALTIGSYEQITCEQTFIAYARKAREREVLVVLDLHGKPARFNLPERFRSARVLLSTNRSRDGELIAGVLELGADEGYVLEAAR
jgi:alpha-glucosidase